MKFKHPELSTQWHPTKNGVLKPEEVSCGSAKKVWWVCPVNCIHSWDASIKSRTRGRGCPKCAKQFSKMQIEWVKSVAETEKIKIRHALCDDGEFTIPDSLYKVDGYCEETNTVYEFHGDYWHGNPNVFDSNDINKNTGKTFGELYENTLRKKEYILSKGFKYVEIWESDFRKT